MLDLGTDDYELIQLTMVELATSSASLDRSPKKNWVENAGNLPPYIRKLARAIEKNGHDLSSAIAIAISRVKKWAAGGEDVDADTRAKAAKALAAWEALKAKNKAKQAVKTSREDGSEFIRLSNISSFNTEMVRNAWYAQTREPSPSVGLAGSAPYSYIRELWTDYIITETEAKDGLQFDKVPYTVSGNVVQFSTPTPVNLVWKEEDLSDNETRLLGDILVKLATAPHPKTGLSTEAREKAASKSEAMPDGSFPIRNKADLSRAIAAIGRAKNPEAVKRFIRKRARALGAADMIPDSWD